MSATGRSDVRDPDDDYTTPAWAVEAIIPYVIPDRPIALLDPCCGVGSILRSVRVQCPWVQRWGIERDPIRAEEARCMSTQVVCRDALASEGWPLADIVLTNPPYRQAQDFLERALLETLPRGGTVCMLLRLNFLASQKRAAFWRSRPCDVHVLSRRPSFVVNGRTDATEYAWFVFAPGRKERRWLILDP